MTKPFYFSKTIISAVVGAVVSLLNLYHINLSDLAPQISDTIGQEIDLVMTIAALAGTIYGRFAATTQVTLGPTPSALKVVLLLLAGGSASVLLVGCAGLSTQVLGSDAEAALSAIHGTTAAALASGELPKGNATGIVTDANTISAGLETLLTGQKLTDAQVNSVATSFKSNTATAGYLQLANTIGSQLVTLVNSRLAAGATPAAAVTAGTQLLVNAPSSVSAALTTGAPASTAAPLATAPPLANP